MSAFFDGIDDAFRVTGLTAPSYPLTICCWFKTSIYQQKDFAGFGQAVNASHAAFLDQNSTVVRSPWVLGGTNSVPQVGGVVLDQWMSIVGAGIGSSDHRVWLNGAVAADTTTNAGLIPATIDRFTIAARSSSAGVLNFWFGRLAAVSVHNFAADDRFAAAHAAGQLPSSLPGCTHYFNLKSGKLDSVGSWALTTLGAPTFDAADEPPIILTPETLIVTAFTRSPSTGQLADATSISARVVVNGTDVVSVMPSVTKKSTGEYKVSTPLPAVAINDYAELIVTASCEGATDSIIVWSNRKIASTSTDVEDAADRILKAIPDATPAGNGGLPIQFAGPAGDGNVLSANVRVAASSRTQIVSDVWQFLTTDIAALATTTWGRWIYDTLGKIYARVAFFGSSSYKSMFAARQGGRVDVTRGDDMTTATGVQYRFVFGGYPDITGKTVKGQIVEMGGDVLHDNLPGGIELSGPDTSVDQIALVSIPEEVSAVLPPTDRADNFDLLCRIEYATGKWVEIGRVALDVLRG